jgi:hypothetical protein
MISKVLILFPRSLGVEFHSPETLTDMFRRYSHIIRTIRHQCRTKIALFPLQKEFLVFHNNVRKRRLQRSLAGRSSTIFPINIERF